MLKRAFALLLLASCAHVPVNEKLTGTISPTYGYRWDNVQRPPSDTFVVVTMSGGGTRAAAFGYGVLQKLAGTPIRGGDLLGAVNVISSVSGGSFTSTYYALHGREGLPRFRKDFLEVNIQKKLFGSIFLPWNFLHLLFSPNFTRIDLAARDYDNWIYHGATYRDMPLKGRPFIIANATEMDLGSQFQFTQEQFDPICSDLSKLHVAYAVASSSAFPGLLVPVTMGDFHDACTYTPPGWFEPSGKDPVWSRRYIFRSNLEGLRDPDRPYLHLMDGGIADNLGLRGPYHAMTSGDTLQVPGGNGGLSILRMVSRQDVRRVAVIIVDAKTENALNLDKSSATPLLIKVIPNIAETPMENFSADTVQLMINDARQISKDFAQTSGPVEYDIYPIYVGFSAVKDPMLRKQLNDIPTSFGITRDQLELLIKAASDILDQSAEYQRLVKNLQ